MPCSIPPQGYDQEGLVCGYVRNQQALGQVLVRRGSGDTISLTAESVLAKGFVLPPGQAVRSEPFMINIAPDPYTALETYAEAMGTLQSARIGSVLNGWCDWFFAYEHITEEEMIHNAEFAARTLKPYGLEYIQVDEGFQRWHGEVQGTLRVRVPPASVTLLALHEKRDVPHVVSTDRHILQGALELESVRWDGDTRTLEGTSLGPEGTAHSVAVYVPQAQPWKQGGPFLFHDLPGYTLKMIGAHILRVRVRFNHAPRVTWKIRVDDLLGR